MRRYRRMVLMDRLIPFLAALVGLIALAGAVLGEYQSQQRTAAVLAELSSLRQGLDAALQQQAAAAPVDDGTAEALLALQERMNGLEAELRSSQEAAASAPAAGAAAEVAAPIDPSLPTEDCIPKGTRFMAVTGESYPICQSPAVVRVTGITGDNVVVEGAGVVTETGFANLAGTTCTLMVVSADVEGFAEMRVNCT